MSSDALSEVLRAVRLRGAVFYDVHASAPWVAEAPRAKELAPMVMPGAEHVIEYHAITSGGCWGGVAGEALVELGAGDIIVFPQGDAHVLASGPKVKNGHKLSSGARPVGGQLPVLIDEGGGGARAELVCGFLGCDARPFNPLLASLPKMIVARSESFSPLVRLAVAESKARRSGGEAVLARLSELLFVEVVRQHLSALPADQSGWLAGLRDDFVGRALALLHDRPTHDWSLDALASEVGLSRSAFAERFTRFAGVPPMQYLAQWRMQLAGQMLSSSSAGLAEVASAVGYGSEAAFSRAFKKLVGVAPAAWREARQGR